MCPNFWLVVSFQLINLKHRFQPYLVEASYLCEIWLLNTAMEKRKVQQTMSSGGMTSVTTCLPLHLPAETGQNLTGSESRHLITPGRTCINKSWLSIQWCVCVCVCVCVCTCHLLFRTTCLSQGLFQLLISLTIVSLSSLNLWSEVTISDWCVILITCKAVQLQLGH